MKTVLTSSSNKQQLIDLFAQKLLIDGIHVKQATGDADMMVVKEALVKPEEFDSICSTFKRYERLQCIVTSFRW